MIFVYQNRFIWYFLNTKKSGKIKRSLKEIQILDFLDHDILA